MGSLEDQTHPHPGLPLEGEGVTHSISNVGTNQGEYRLGRSRPQNKTRYLRCERVPHATNLVESRVTLRSPNLHIF